MAARGLRARWWLVCVLLAGCVGCGGGQEPVSYDEVLGVWSSREGGEVVFTADSRFEAERFLLERPEGDSRVSGAGDWDLGVTGSGRWKISLGFDPGVVPGVLMNGGSATSLDVTKDGDGVRLLLIRGDPDAGRFVVFAKE